MDTDLQELREKLESPDLSFITGGYLRYGLSQTTLQVTISKPRPVDIFEEFILRSAIDLNPPPTQAEIAEMLGIDPMFVKNITQTLEVNNNLDIDPDSVITVKSFTQELFIEKNCILQPQSTPQIYAIEDLLTGDVIFNHTPQKNAPFSLNILDVDDLIDDPVQLANESHFSLETLEEFISKNNHIFVTKYNEIESKTIYQTIGLLIFQDINSAYLIKVFSGEQEVEKLSNLLTEKLTIKQNFNLEELKSLLSPNIPDEIVTSVTQLQIPKFLSGKSMEPQQVYIGLPQRLADAVLWVGDKYRTNPLSRRPGGSDVVVEYHNGYVLGYDKIKYPPVYIHTFFPGIVEYGGDEFNRLDERQKLQIAKQKIARFYWRTDNNDQDYSTANFVEVWNSETSNEMPWESFRRFKHQQRNQYHFNFDEVSEFKPISIWDYYGYEPEYEDPIDKAERLYGIPDPRLVED